jgi:hypothetical protein
MSLIYLLISTIISLFFYRINVVKSISFNSHNEFYRNLLNESDVLNAELFLNITWLKIKIYIDQKYIYFFYENIFTINSIFTEIDETKIMMILSTINIFIFLLFLFFKLKLRLIHIVCISIPQIIMLMLNRGMGIYFLSQSISERFFDFLKSLFFPFTSNSPFGYEPRSSSALLISLLIIGSGFQYKNRNVIFGLVLGLIPIIHLPTSLVAIPVILMLWRFKILNLSGVYFYLLITGLLSIKLLLSVNLVQNENLVVPFNLISVGIIILSYYKLIILKNIEYQKFTKSSIYCCYSTTFIYLTLSFSLTLLNFYVEKNGYYLEQYWIKFSLLESPARINSFLTIPIYYIIINFILKGKRKEFILKKQ